MDDHIVLTGHIEFFTQLEGPVIAAELQPYSLTTDFLFLIPDQGVEE